MYYAQLNSESICVCVIDTRVESTSKKDIKLSYFDTSYIGKKYQNGKWIEDTVLPEPVTEQEQLQAEMLLNQCNLLINQENQDKVLAELLLNQLGV